MDNIAILYTVMMYFSENLREKKAGKQKDNCCCFAKISWKVIHKHHNLVTSFSTKKYCASFSED